ncbi:MAG: glycerol kinase [Elusimicrobia bacterium]|nr:glycerol kinase [Elusimicrobiota bacterium]
MSRQKSPLVIALDQGSSSSRALAVDERGGVAAQAQVPLKIRYPRPGWAEHEAGGIAASQEKALDAVLAQIPSSREIIGLGLACQRSTIILWDRETGKALARAPSWQDGRAAPLVESLGRHQEEVHERTGLYLTPYYSAPKIRWLLDHTPAARKALDAGRLMAGPVGSYLIWRWTGGEVFAADPTLAQRTLLMNLSSMDWDGFMLDIFKIPRAVMPEIRPSAGSWGFMTRRGRRLAILACAGDQQAAALGLGARAPGSFLANYGTGAFLLYNTGASFRRLPGLLTSVGAGAAGEAPYFFQEGTVHAAGACLDWLAGLGLLRDVSSADRLCRESKERVWALPAIGGLGAPRWDYKTQSAFAGLTSRTRGPDLVRAAVESVAFLVCDIASVVRRGGFRLGPLRTSGGLSRISHLMQAQADLLGLPVERLGQSEATALGAAELAARAAGRPWREGRPRPERVFKPRLSARERERLLLAWRAFVAGQAELSRQLAGLEP